MSHGHVSHIELDGYVSLARTEAVLQKFWAEGQIQREVKKCQIFKSR